MKTLLALITVLWGLAPHAISQLPSNPKIKQLRIGYYTEKIPLSATDAQKFWPVFNAYSEEIEAVQKEMKLRAVTLKRTMNQLSESEIQAASEELMSYKRKRLAIIERYYPQFQEILSPKKLLRFYYAEEEFPRWVLKQLRSQNANRNPRNRW